MSDEREKIVRTNDADKGEGEEEESICSRNPNLGKCKYILLLEETGRYLAIMFIVALVAAAVLLASGREALANRAAEYAYYLLVASVLSLLTSTFLEPRVEEEGEKPPEAHGGEAPLSEKPEPSLVGGLTAGVKSLLAPFLTRVSHLLERAGEGRLLVALGALGLAGSFSLAGTLVGLSVVPGRPTIIVDPLEWSRSYLAVSLALSLVAAPLVYRALGGIGLIIYLVILAVSPLQGWASIIPVGLVVSTIIRLLEPPRILITVNLTLLILALVGLVRPLHTWMSAWGWAGLTAASVAALVLLFVSLTLVSIDSLERLAVVLKKSGGRGGRPLEDFPGGEGDEGSTPLEPLRELPTVAVVALFASVLTVGSLHFKTEGIVSLDTVFHTSMCIAYSGGFQDPLTWERPLFTTLACGGANLVGDYILFFDVIVPLLGLTLLVTVIYALARDAGLGQEMSLIASIIALAYWAPFFIYAGFQTNLLALPLALIMARYSARDVEKGTWSPQPVFIALVLALFHPWTLAYYTVGILFHALITTEGRVKRSLKTLAYTLGPAWLAYFALMGEGGYAILQVTERAISPQLQGDFDITNALRVFAWGTALRADALLPFALLYLAYQWGAAREGGARGLGVARSWPMAFTLITGLGVFLLGRGELIIRLLIDMPIPLAYAMLAERVLGGGVGRLKKAVMIAPIIMVMSYYIVFAPFTPIEINWGRLVGLSISPPT